MITLLTLAFIILLLVLFIKFGWIILVIGVFMALDIFVVAKIIKTVSKKIKKLFMKNKEKEVEE